MRGNVMIGAYPLEPDGTTPWVAADFDGHNGTAFADSREVADMLVDVGITPICNTSQSGKGVHVRVVFDEPMEAWIARSLILAIIDETGVEHLTEGGSYDRPFPTQDRLRDDSKAIGNQIAMPLHKGAADERRGALLLDQQFSLVPLGDATWDILELYEWVTRDQIVNAMMELGRVHELTKQVGPLPYSGSPDRQNNDEPGLEERKGPILYLLRQCEFFKKAMENPLRYEEWIALASNLAVFEGGRQIFHKISALDKRYDRQQAEIKFQDIQTSFRSVVTCVRLADFGWRCSQLGDDGECEKFRRGERGAKAPAAVAHYL